MPRKKPTVRLRGDESSTRGVASLPSDDAALSLSPTAMAQDLGGTISSRLDAFSLDVDSAELGADNEEDWVLQSVEEIVADARRRVQENKPWRKDVDDAVLERQRLDELRSGRDRGYHIILPDSRVRTMDENFSRRVRVQLLGLEEGEEEEKQKQQKKNKRPEKPKPKAPAKIQNPWYLPAKSWYIKKADKDELDNADLLQSLTDGRKVRAQLLGLSERTEKDEQAASGQPRGKGGRGRCQTKEVDPQKLSELEQLQRKFTTASVDSGPFQVSQLSAR